MTLLIDRRLPNLWEVLGDAVPQTPWDFSHWAKIEEGAGVQAPPALSTSARIRRSGCFPAEPYPPIRLQAFIPKTLVPCNRQATQLRSEQAAHRNYQREVKRPARPRFEPYTGGRDRSATGTPDAEYDPPSSPTIRRQRTDEIVFSKRGTTE